MKLKIARSDSIVIEIDGTDEEVSRIVPLVLPFHFNALSNVTWGWTDNTVNLLCKHEYPNPWFSTVPPKCLKCGG